MGIIRRRRLWWLALVAVVPILVCCGSPLPSSAGTKDTYTTKPGIVPRSIRVAQVSDGPRIGMRIVGSPNLVWVWGQSGRVTFGLALTNKGTMPYSCKSLQATQIPTRGVYRGHFSPAPGLSCPGPGQTIAPGSRAFVTFFLPGNAHPPKDVVVLPYGSNEGRMVWTVASCPTIPRTCFWRSQKLGY
jgi:hypothetical protein